MTSRTREIAIIAAVMLPLVLVMLGVVYAVAEQPRAPVVERKVHADAPQPEPKRIDARRIDEPITAEWGEWD